MGLVPAGESIGQTSLLGGAVGAASIVYWVLGARKLCPPTIANNLLAAQRWLAGSSDEDIGAGVAATPSVQPSAAVTAALKMIQASKGHTLNKTGGTFGHL